MVVPAERNFPARPGNLPVSPQSTQIHISGSFIASISQVQKFLSKKRRFAGAELKVDYYDIAVSRITDAIEGRAKIRDDVPVASPNPNTAVAKLPKEFAKARKIRID